MAETGITERERGRAAPAQEALEGRGEKVSLNDFVLKATAAALRRHPEVNSAWHGDLPAGSLLPTPQLASQLSTATPGILARSRGEPVTSVSPWATAVAASHRSEVENCSTRRSPSSSRRRA